MIILIGGPPKCGKTTLAKIVSRDLHIPWISTDILQEIVFAHTDKKSISKKFPYKIIKKKTKGNTDILYKEYSINQIIRLYRIAARSTSKAIETMLAHEVENKHSFILEGLHLEPKLVYQLLRKHGKEKFKVVFLIKKDWKNFVRDVKKSTTHNDWVLRKTKNKETFIQIAKMIVTYSFSFEKEERKYNFKVLTMDTEFMKKLKTFRRSCT